MSKQWNPLASFGLKPRGPVAHRRGEAMRKPPFPERTAKCPHGYPTIVRCTRCGEVPS